MESLVKIVGERRKQFVALLLGLYAAYKWRQIRAWFSGDHSVKCLGESMGKPSPDIFPDRLLNADGLWLRTYTWRAPRSVPFRGKIAIVHGYGEHAQRYAGVVKKFNLAGFDVYAMDHQGHGLSEGDRVHFTHFDDVVRDFVVFLKTRVVTEDPQAPLFIFGHSMGGLVAIRALTKIPEVKKLCLGAVLSAPALVIPKDTRKPHLELIGRAIASFLPKMAVGELDTNKTSNNPMSVMENHRDCLTGLAGHRALCVTQMLDVADECCRPEYLKSLTTPFLAYGSVKDELVAAGEAVEKLKAASSEDKTCLVLTEGGHELHLERPEISNNILDRVIEWVAVRTPKMAER